MKTAIHSQPLPGQRMSRATYLTLLQTAIHENEYRFAREAALSWLAAFPGDLQAGLLYARALIEDQHARQALPVLDSLCQTDPECLQAQGLLLAGRRACGLPTAPDTVSNVLALGGEVREQDTVATWGKQLWLARKALEQGELTKAEQMVRQILGSDPPTPLLAVTHLQTLEKAGQAPLQARRNLAEFYHQRWPACLPCILYLADWLMDGGESEQAVALLHEAAVRDTGGQVAERLWGPDHPYRAIWPEQLELALKIQVPAKVAVSMGWNQLAAGRTAVPEDTWEDEPDPEWDLFEAADLEPASPPDVPEMNAVDGGFPPDEGALSNVKHDLEGAADDLSLKNLSGEATQGNNSYTQPSRRTEEASVKSEHQPETLRSVQQELERIAKRLNRRGMTRMEGRYPVYVVLSVRAGLEGQYGALASAEIEMEMERLVGAIQARKGWNARLFLADEPASTTQLGIRPARPSDAWEIKLTLADLDAELARSGEMIGALLIVGGPEVVPFHFLPNPVDDDDPDVPSDNPYATRDENYFIPEWPVGRLPGGAGKDPSALLSALRRIRSKHLSQARRAAWYYRWWERLLGWLRPVGIGGRPSFGYTAAIWRKASLTVYRPIGESRSLLVSPPTGVNGSASNGHSAVPIPITRMGYFNLHGLSDAGEWYGQRDPFENQDGPDYPVALRPEDIGVSEEQGEPCAPQVIFSEACYGLNILGRDTNQSMALKFLAAGSQAVAGSSCMAYGSVSTPLIAADLLGHSFWYYLREGLTSGEALRRAKIRLAREMHERQGYLDGEDQKTLISFMLFGDPLAQPNGQEYGPKSPLRRVKPYTQIKTICDRAIEPEASQAAPEEVLSYVKHVVEQYLPGMEDAHLTFSREHAECHTAGHTCPTGQMKNMAHPQSPPERQLVTLSKQVLRANHVHPQYARLTLDGDGKLVKLVVSR